MNQFMKNKRIAAELVSTLPNIGVCRVYEHCNQTSFGNTIDSYCETWVAHITSDAHITLLSPMPNSQVTVSQNLMSYIYNIIY